MQVRQEQEYAHRRLPLLIGYGDDQISTGLLEARGCGEDVIGSVGVLEDMRREYEREWPPLAQRPLRLRRFERCRQNVESQRTGDRGAVTRRLGRNEVGETVGAEPVKCTTEPAADLAHWLGAIERQCAS